MRKIHKTKPINWFLLGIIALPLVAAGSYFWATSMISSLENYRSPLHATPPAPGPRLGEPLTRRVIIVLLDALRYDTSADRTVMPFLNQLRDGGASAVMKSRPPSFSAPGWATLLTGAWPDLNDSQPFNPPDENSVRPFTQDDIFSAADRAGLSTAVSGYFWFEQFLADSGLDTGYFTPGEDKVADQEVVNNCLPWLKEDYQLILIHIDQIDYAGHHEGGPLDPRWNSAASRSDGLLGLIVDQLDLELDTVIIVSDHGQIDKGGHGGNEVITLVEPFVAIGKGVVPGIYTEITMVDVAPTISVLLGINIPASDQGQPLFEMLDISPEYTLIAMDALKSQQSLLLTAYTNAIGQPVRAIDKNDSVEEIQNLIEQARMSRLGQEQIWRNMLALFLGFTPGYMLFLRKDKKSLWMFVGALVYLSVFNFRYAVLDQNTYGLSWIPGLINFIFYIGTTTTISLLIAWLIIMIQQHAFFTPPLQAAASALGGIWFILYLLGIPILFNFAANGVLPIWTLPQFTVQYLGFFAIMQSLYVAILGILLVGLSALIAKFTQKT